MRIGCYQSVSPAGDMAKGYAVIEAALAQAAFENIDMLVMPELFLPGYNAVTRAIPQGWDRVMPDLQQMCRKHSVALTIGLPEYTPDAVYNAAYVIGAAGQCLAKYRKIQLFGPREVQLFTPGETLCTFEYLGTTFGLLICYDIEFPEHARALARAGVSVILTPTANMEPFIGVNTILVPARALENAITIAYANYAGSEGDLTYVGHSLIVGPDGTPQAVHKTGGGMISASVTMDTATPVSTQRADFRPAKASD